MQFSIDEELAHSITDLMDQARQEADSELAFEPKDEFDAKRRALRQIVQRQGQSEFRTLLIEAYDRRCAISDCDCIDALEAAHIRPYNGPQTNKISNGVLLRADLHTLLDLEKIKLTADRKVLVSDGLLKSVYGSFHDKALRLPKKRMHWPEIKAYNRALMPFAFLSKNVLRLA